MPLLCHPIPLPFFPSPLLFSPSNSSPFPSVPFLLFCLPDSSLPPSFSFAVLFSLLFLSHPLLLGVGGLGGGTLPAPPPQPVPPSPLFCLHSADPCFSSPRCCLFSICVVAAISGCASFLLSSFYLQPVFVLGWPSLASGPRQSRVPLCALALPPSTSSLLAHKAAALRTTKCDAVLEGFLSIDKKNEQNRLSWPLATVMLRHRSGDYRELVSASFK